MSTLEEVKKNSPKRKTLSAFGKIIKRALIDKSSNTSKMCAALKLPQSCMSYWVYGERLMPIDVFEQVLAFFDGHPYAQKEILAEYFELTGQVTFVPDSLADMGTLINLKVRANESIYTAVNHILKMSPQSLASFLTMMETACKSTPSNLANGE